MRLDFHLQLAIQSSELNRHSLVLIQSQNGGACNVNPGTPSLHNEITADKRKMEELSSILQLGTNSKTESEGEKNHKCALYVVTLFFLC